MDGLAWNESQIKPREAAKKHKRKLDKNQKERILPLLDDAGQ